MSIVATEPAGGSPVIPVHDDPPLITSGLMDAYRRWWQSVQQVHSLLELGGAPTGQVTQILETERRTRQEYAGMLRGSNRPVADYLAEHLAFPPLWPVPEPPVAQY
ncbi:MAG: hypothetical protein WCA46_22185 [Actinocatenispora sp.]